MGEEDSKMDEKWQAYMQRRRRGKQLILLGMVSIIVSLPLAILPLAVAAYTGTLYISSPWGYYAGWGIVFGILLILAGIISRIAPDFMEGDALWAMKMGPYTR